MDILLLLYGEVGMNGVLKRAQLYLQNRGTGVVVD
jgi:hypothetical protein